MRTRHRNRWLLSVLVSLCLTLCACSSGSQREISTDTESYLTALRAALRQSPDVILLVMAKRLNLN